MYSIFETRQALVKARKLGQQRVLIPFNQVSDCSNLLAEFRANHSKLSTNDSYFCAKQILQVTQTGVIDQGASQYGEHRDGDSDDLSVRQIFSTPQIVLYATTMKS